jgi:fluoroquinolone resistance protein
MLEKVFENTIFDKNNTIGNYLQRGEYINCTFKNLDLSCTDLSNFVFEDCGFQQCNLSNSKWNNVAVRDVQFTSCKMLGIHFETCIQFGLAFTFENCLLCHSSIYKTKIKKTIFTNCNLQDVDFVDADLSECQFINCDLGNAHFENTNLQKADLSTSYNFSIDPEKNKIAKATFNKLDLAGLLYKYNIVLK